MESKWRSSFRECILVSLRQNLTFMPRDDSVGNVQVFENSGGCFDRILKRHEFLVIALARSLICTYPIWRNHKIQTQVTETLDLFKIENPSSWTLYFMTEGRSEAAEWTKKRTKPIFVWIQCWLVRFNKETTSQLSSTGNDARSKIHCFIFPSMSSALASWTRSEYMGWSSGVLNVNDELKDLR